MNNKQHDRKLFEEALKQVSENSEKKLNEIIDPFTLAGIAIGGAALAGGAAKFVGDVRRARREAAREEESHQDKLRTSRLSRRVTRGKEEREQARHPHEVEGLELQNVSRRGTESRAQSQEERDQARHPHEVEALELQNVSRRGTESRAESQEARSAALHTHEVESKRLANVHAVSGETRKEAEEGRRKDLHPIAVRQARSNLLSTGLGNTAKMLANRLARAVLPYKTSEAASSATSAAYDVASAARGYRWKEEDRTNAQKEADEQKVLDAAARARKEEAEKTEAERQRELHASKVGKSNRDAEAFEAEQKRLADAAAAMNAFTGARTGYYQAKTAEITGGPSPSSSPAPAPSDASEPSKKGKAASKAVKKILGLDDIEKALGKEEKPKKGAKATSSSDTKKSARPAKKKKKTTRAPQTRRRKPKGKKKKTNESIEIYKNLIMEKIFKPNK